MYIEYVARLSALDQEGQPMKAPQSLQRYLLSPGQGMQLCVDTLGDRSRPAVIWLADPLSLHVRQCWDGQFSSVLADGSYFLLRYDLRGLGDSGKPEEEDAYALAVQAGDLNEVIRSFEVQRCVIVAAGWAGAILAEYLRRYARGGSLAVSGVILQGAVTQVGRLQQPMAYPDLEVWATMLSARNVAVRRVALERYLRGTCVPGPVPEELICQMIETALAMPPAALRALFGAYVRSAQLDEAGAEFVMPTLVCYGEEDKRVDPGYAGIVERQFPCSVTHLYPRAGHCLAFEEQTSHDIALFLESVLV